MSHLNQLNDVKEDITVYVEYGYHTIAVIVYKRQLISEILEACLIKFNLNDYHIENSLGMVLKTSWSCAVLNHHQRLFIKKD